MKRSLFFTLLALGLIGLSFIYFADYIVSAPSLETIEIEAEIEKEEVELEEEVIVETPKASEVEIVAVGDLMFHLPQINGARLQGGGYDFNRSFTYIKTSIESADISIANIETVTAGNEKGFNGFPRFNCPVEVLDNLKNAGFDILVTANNHSLDGGKAGIINTINEIEKRGLDYVGTSKEERRPFIIVEKEGIKIGLLSYTYGLNGLDSLLSNEDRSRMINLIDLENIQKDIVSLKNESVDFIISYIHWGNEYQREPSEVQEKLANRLADFGVDLILGSHPHVIQKSEVLQRENHSTYVVYSMGNFISNQTYETMGVSYAEDGLIVRAKIIKDHETGITSLGQVNYEPTWVYRVLENNKYSHYIIPIEKALNGDLDIEFSQKTIERLKKSKIDTLNPINN